MVQHALEAPPAPPFSRATRNARLTEVEDQPFDLLVVGAGITGAGIARDAAMRGLRVALVDKGDLASGTSSASSKLVHGGLRYLEHRQFSLVFESVSERARLGERAPHLVRPLPFFFPIYRKRPALFTSSRQSMGSRQTIKMQADRVFQASCCGYRRNRKHGFCILGCREQRALPGSSWASLQN